MSKKKEFKRMAENARLEAGKLMTSKQIALSNTIIHTASAACGACGAIPIPIADAIPMSAAQVTMIISLGEAFDRKLTESGAKAILSSASAAIVGRAVAGGLLKFIPVAGWVVSAAIAAAVTEAIGWKIACDFAKQYQNDYEVQRVQERAEEAIEEEKRKAENKFASMMDDMEDPYECDDINLNIQEKDNYAAVPDSFDILIKYQCSYVYNGQYNIVHVGEIMPELYGEKKYISISGKFNGLELPEIKGCIGDCSLSNQKTFIPFETSIYTTLKHWCLGNINTIKYFFEKHNITENEIYDLANSYDLPSQNPQLNVKWMKLAEELLRSSNEEMSDNTNDLEEYTFKSPDQILENIGIKGYETPSSFTINDLSIRLNKLVENSKDIPSDEYDYDIKTDLKNLVQEFNEHKSNIAYPKELGDALDQAIDVVGECIQTLVGFMFGIGTEYPEQRECNLNMCRLAVKIARCCLTCPEYKQLSETEYDNLKHELIVLQKKSEEFKNGTVEVTPESEFEMQRNGIKRILRRHLGDNIIITDFYNDETKVQALDESELLEGELSAVLFNVGCYSIRSSKCLYRDEDKNNNHYTDRHPATREEIRMVKEMNFTWSIQPEGFRIVDEIAAKYNETEFAMDYKFVCMATTARSSRWSETINTICTVMHNQSIPNNETILYVNQTYIGDSFSVDDWYAFYPDGTIKSYRIHPFDKDSADRKWLTDK